MIAAIHTIPYQNLAIAFIPVLAVIIIMWQWKMKTRASMYAVLRMLIQLMLIGYVLVFIFKTDSSLIVMSVLFVMLVSASWISLRTIDIPLKQLYLKSFASIVVGGGFVLILVTQFVLSLDPWFEPSFMIPLAGMIFANSMNAVSLAGERLEAEMTRDIEYNSARNIALKASLIPITNALLAVGLVSLPGMMTGQILSGVSPFTAARYQIMVMCMIFGSSGISAALFMTFTKKDFTEAVNFE